MKTRKTVTLTVTAVFEGDYYEAAEAPSVLDDWIGGSFEDRDDLGHWSVVHVSTVEESLI